MRWLQAFVLLAALARTILVITVTCAVRAAVARYARRVARRDDRAHAVGSTG